jgi:hypothetical protein
MPNTDHYLTPDGWVESDHSPKNAVECWKRETFQSDNRLTIDYSRRWANPEWSSEQRKSLRDSFQLPEAGVSAAFADVCWEVPD